MDRLKESPEDGSSIAKLETMIILAAYVVVAAVFFIILWTGTATP